MPETPPSQQTSVWAQADFTKLWAVGMLTFIVRWLEILAFGVYTYQVTDSSTIVAMMTMLRLLPMGLFGMLFGVLAARLPHRAGLLVIIASLWLTSFVMCVAAFDGELSVWYLALASFINGTAWAADNPFRRAMIGDTVGPRRMGSAMSFDVGASNASRLAGPALGGLLLATAGIFAVFVFGLVSYTVALIIAWRLGRRPVQVPTSQPSLFRALADGLLAARANPRLAGTLWVTIAFNLFGWPVASMVPVIARDQLGLAADGTGLLASLDGLGALLTAIVLTQLTRAQQFGRLYVCGVFLYLLMLIGFAQATNVTLAGAALFGMGCGQATFAVMQATLVYLSAAPNARPQAMGLLTMCIGLGPIGFIWIGALAERLGAPMASSLTALIGIAAMALTWPWWRAVWHAPTAPPEKP